MWFIPGPPAIFLPKSHANNFRIGNQCRSRNKNRFIAGFGGECLKMFVNAVHNILQRCCELSEREFNARKSFSNFWIHKIPLVVPRVL